MIGPPSENAVLLAVAALLARAGGLLGRRLCAEIRLRIGHEGSASNSLVPDLVTAVIAAPETWSYSAL